MAGIGVFVDQITEVLSWRLKHQLVWVKGGCGNMAA
jgi:hypothetical protein